MNVLQLESASLPVNLGGFFACSVVLWFAAKHLALFAKVLADRTELGQAFIGTVVVGAIVSLPEMTMALAASVMGNEQLAAGTLLGGIVFATLILAITDAVVGSEPLSSDISAPVVPLQGALVVLMLVVTAAGIAAGDIAVYGVGLWTSGLLVLYALIVWLVKHTQQSHAWVAQDPLPNESSHSGPPQSRYEHWSVRRVALLTALAACMILITGVFATQTADHVARQTGLGASFVGLVLGGMVTSLPEVSSTYSAARLKQYQMVFSDAFGTNLFSVMLLFFCDVVSPGEPILNGLGRFSLVATLLGAAVTAIYVAGLLARPRHVVLRMGIDSVLVLLMSLGGLWLLFWLR
jgi:cation:H+ antiporter